MRKPSIKFAVLASMVVITALLIYFLISIYFPNSRRFSHFENSVQQTCHYEGALLRPDIGPTLKNNHSTVPNASKIQQFSSQQSEQPSNQVEKHYSAESKGDAHAFYELNYVQMSNGKWNFRKRNSSFVNIKQYPIIPLTPLPLFWRVEGGPKGISQFGEVEDWPNHRSSNNLVFDAAVYSPVPLDFENMWHAMMDFYVFIYQTLRDYYNSGVRRSIALLLHTNTCCSYRKYTCHDKESCLSPNFQSVQLLYALAGGSENVFWTDEKYITNYKDTDFYFKKVFVGLDVSCRVLEGNHFTLSEVSNRRKCLELYFEMGTFFLTYFGIINSSNDRYLTPQTSNLHNVVYLSRKDATNKRIENEDEFLSVLRTQLPKNTRLIVVQFSKISLVEQLRIVHEASIFIAGRGAGMANVVYLKKGAHYVHICPDMFPFTSFKDLVDVDWFSYSTIDVQVVCNNSKCNTNWGNWRINVEHSVKTVLDALNKVHAT